MINMERMNNYCLILILVLCVGYGTSFILTGGPPLVQTNVGEIRGQVANVPFETKIFQALTFLGIPYAKAPVGDLRFKKPEPLTTLPHSPFNAVKLAPVCPQSITAAYGLTSSEDCLALNIYAPATAGQLSPTKAVMIWIHGGGFTTGFSDIYDGSVLSAVNDVIVVTMNYRLGPLGFLSTHDQNAPGNYGLWDQQLAIKWVHDNIALFGGDPNNILVFGESAGSSSVVYQTLFPGNKGMVKRAIAESGSIAAWGYDRMGKNQQGSVDFAKYVGCESMGTVNMTCMRSKSTEEMRMASEKYQQTSSEEIINTWVPVFDNDFVMADTQNILKDMSTTGMGTPYAETFHSIDFMIGACNMDGIVFLTNWLELMNSTGQNGFTSAEFDNVVIPRIAENVLNEKPTPLVLDAIKYEYTNWDDPNNPTKRLQTLIDITTDFALNEPTIVTANNHLLGNKSTYVFQFATSPPGLSFLRVPPVLKTDTAASHSDEIGFVLGFPFAFIYGLNYTFSDISAEQFKVSRAIMAMWTNFAKTGNPNTPVDLQQIYSGLVWPEYDMNGAKYLQITPRMSTQSVKTRLAARAVQFWSSLLPDLQMFSKMP